MMTKKKIEHALVVGGTGMLRDLSFSLAAKGFNVSVIARDKEKLANLKNEAKKLKGSVNPISLDYRNLDLLRDGVRQSKQKLGLIKLAIIWVHSTAPKTVLEAAKLVGDKNNPAHFYHIQGSADESPENEEVSRLQSFKCLENILYHEVILGFVVENNGSRWLTDKEISAGVLDAVNKGAKRYIVGVIQPWSAKP